MLTDDSTEVGWPLSGLSAVDGSQLAAGQVAGPVVAAFGAADHRGQVHAPVASAPIGSTCCSALTGRAGVGAVPDALLAHLDQATGPPVRKPDPVRYEKDTPGELIHVDIKKLGRIPDGGGHRILGRTAGNRNNKKQGRGYAFCTTPSTTTHGWAIQRSWAMNAATPQPRSGPGPTRSSPLPASP